jgi:hypothetical protein
MHSRANAWRGINFGKNVIFDVFVLQIYFFASTKSNRCERNLFFSAKCRNNRAKAALNTLRKQE